MGLFVKTQGQTQASASEVTSDQAALERAGKKQVLKVWRRPHSCHFQFLTAMKREWNFWAVLGFSTVTLATWEATSALFSAAYTNGGPASVVYGFIVSALGTVVIAASLAEMASMLVPMNTSPSIAYLSKL
jgi:hypothetical protein